MKKIKLLTGLSTLSVLGLSTLPLTSCNKFDGKVSEQEWKEAIGYMCGYSDQDMYWRFSQDDYAGMLFENEDSKNAIWFYDWTVTPRGMHAKGTITDIETNDTEQTDVYELFAGEMGYTKATDGQGDVSFSCIEEGGPYLTMLGFFSTIYDYYEDFTFSNGYFTYSGKLGDIVLLNTKIGFNSNKKISSLETTCKMDMTEQEHMIATFGANIHFDYSQKEIEWPQDLLDRYSKHVFNLSNSAQIDLSNCKTETEGTILVINPDNDGYSKIAIYDNQTLEDPVQVLSYALLIKNGKKLTVNVDYSFSSEYVTFTEPLTKDDIVSIKSQPRGSSWCKEYTFKLEQ